MAKFKFHQLAAIAVLIGFAAWMGTGKFSSVGSAVAEDEGAATPKPPAASAEAATPAARTVAVVIPPRTNHARAIRLSGLTEADKRTVLATRAGGIIEELPIRQGDRVTKGQKLLGLAEEGREAALELARQVLKQRQAELEAAQRLAKTGTMPKLQLDTAVSAVSQAQSQLKAAEAELDRLTVMAPFDGVIDQVNVELGSSVAQGAQVATLLALDPVVVRGEVSERDLRFVRIGDKAEARLVNDEVVTGEVRYISRESTPATRTYRVEVAIPNGDDRVPAGMTAEITVRAEGTDSVVLPRSVVTLSAKGDLGIRAVGPDNKVAFYPIDLVDDLSGGLVLGGVPADARVIVAGQEMVTEGETVNPVQADPEMIKKLVGEATGTN
ncbi:MAG: efflux RND transporter periplasmic adaptor subunit [Mesorhizobium sp.]